MAVLTIMCVGCGENPLSDKVAELEDRVAGLESEAEPGRERQRAELLYRLDRLAVTPETADEVAEIRAKLAQDQEGISELDFRRLELRVVSLERKITDWSLVVARASRSVYAVLHGTFVDEDEVDFTFIGTGFSVDTETLLTNGHIADALVGLDQQVQSFNRRFGASVQTRWILVRNLANRLRYGSNFFFASGVAVHPDWNPRSVTSPDVAVLRLADEKFPRQVALVSSVAAMRLRVGEPIATLGFPGELQGSRLSNFLPIATFKDGSVSALRPPQPGQPYSARTAYIVQHNLDLSGGTSGSPIFNRLGEVVAINNAGIERLVLTIGGNPARVSQAALGFGIRADKIHELLELLPAAKRLETGSGSSAWSLLEGSDPGDLNIHRGSDDLEERLHKLVSAGP